MSDSSKAAVYGSSGNSNTNANSSSSSSSSSATPSSSSSTISINVTPSGPGRYRISLHNPNHRLHFHLFRRRWFVLFVFSTLSLLNNTICYSFASVNYYAQVYYGKGVDLSSLVSSFFIIYVIFSFPSSFLIERIGFRNGLLVGAACQSLGTLIRSLADRIYTEAVPEPTVVLIGQVIAGLGQAFLVNPPSLMSAIWFGKHERTLATTIAVNANTLGIAAAYILGPFLVTSPDDIPQYLSVITYMTLFISGLCFFVPDRPPTPPSKSQLLIRLREKQAEADKEKRKAAGHAPNSRTPLLSAPAGTTQKKSSGGLLEVPGKANGTNGTNGTNGAPVESYQIDPAHDHATSAVVEETEEEEEEEEEESEASQPMSEQVKVMLALFSYKGFVHTIFAFMLAEATINGVSAFMNAILTPQGYSDHFIGLMAMAFIFSCLFGSAIIGYVVDYTKWYKGSLLLSLFGASISVGAFIIFSADSALDAVLTICFMGFFIGPIQPIAIESGVECTFPNPESSVTAVQQVLGNVASAALFPLIVLLREPLDPEAAALVRQRQQEGGVSSGGGDDEDMVGEKLDRPLWLIAASLLIMVPVYATFNGKYLRLEQEQEVKGRSASMSGAGSNQPHRWSTSSDEDTGNRIRLIATASK